MLESINTAVEHTYIISKH